MLRNVKVWFSSLLLGTVACGNNAVPELDSNIAVYTKAGQGGNASGGNGGKSSAAAGSGDSVPDEGGASGEDASPAGAGRGTAGASGARAGSGGTGGKSAAGSGSVGRAGTGGATAAAGSTGGGPTMVSAECKACQAAIPVCDTRQTACFEATGEAAAGPGAGMATKDLCQAVLSCVLSSQCGLPTQDDFPACYCGAGVAVETCYASAGAAQGPCRAELEAGTEVREPSQVAERLVDPTNAAGLAYNTYQCALRYCPKSCGLCVAGDAACADTTPDTMMMPPEMMGEAGSGASGASGASGNGGGFFGMGSGL